MTLRKGIRMMRMRMTRMRGRSSQVSRLTAALTSACELGPCSVLLLLRCCCCEAAGPCLLRQGCCEGCTAAQTG